MPFYQTNPPILRDFFDARGCEYISCDGKSGKKSVGSFWKTNPPGGGFEGVFVVLSACFDLFLRREERADANAVKHGAIRKRQASRPTISGAVNRARTDGWASVCDLGTTWSRLHSVTALPTEVLRGCNRRLETDQRGQMATGCACDETVS